MVHPSTLTASSITATGATLTIANHTAAWWYKSDTAGATTCESVAANTGSKALSGLTPATSYTYSAYSASGCADANRIATASAFTTGGVSVSNLGKSKSGAISLYSDFPRLAQAFTTGPSGGGYTLNTVTIDLRTGASQTLTVTLHDAASNGKRPDRGCAGHFGKRCLCRRRAHIHVQRLRVRPGC